MKANQIVISKNDMDLDIAEITLLSADEYMAARNIIPKRDRRWWLRSPFSVSYFSAKQIEAVEKAADVLEEISKKPYYTSFVSGNCGLPNFEFVFDESIGVSPALRVRNLRSFNLNPGDKLELAGRTWTIVSDDMVLCDGIVGKTFFRKDWRAKDANVYETSDIKIWLLIWASENGIELSL